MATSDDSEIAARLDDFHMTQPTEAQVIAALNEYRSYVLAANLGSLKYCIRRSVETDFGGTPSDDYQSDSEGADSENEAGLQQQQQKLKDEYEYQLEYIGNMLGTELSEDISTPWDVLERLDDFVRPCGLDGVLVNYWHLDKEEHARKREDWKRELLAELRRKAAPEVAMNLELPHDFCVLLEEVDAVLSWGPPGWRYLMPDFIDGLTVDVPEIAAKVLTVSELDDWLDWGWEAAAGWESSNGGHSQSRGQAVYARFADGPWKWRYRILWKGGFLWFENIIELLHYAKTYREVGCSEVFDDTADQH